MLHGKISRKRGSPSVRLNIEACACIERPINVFAGRAATPRRRLAGPAKKIPKRRQNLGPKSFQRVVRRKRGEKPGDGRNANKNTPALKNSAKNKPDKRAALENRSDKLKTGAGSVGRTPSQD